VSRSSPGVSAALSPHPLDQVAKVTCLPSVMRRRDGHRQAGIR
jgi:hypothetical protein